MADTKAKKPRAKKAAAKPNPKAGAMDYPAHEASYDRFIGMTKYGIYVTIAVVVLVIYVLTN